MEIRCVSADASFFGRMATMREDASGRRQRAVMATDAEWERIGRAREAPREELGLEAGRRWLALAPEHRADTLILAPTHAICRQA